MLPPSFSIVAKHRTVFRPLGYPFYPLKPSALDQPLVGCTNLLVHTLGETTLSQSLPRWQRRQACGVIWSRRLCSYRASSMVSHDSLLCFAVLCCHYFLLWDLVRYSVVVQSTRRRLMPRNGPHSLSSLPLISGRDLCPRALL